MSIIVVPPSVTPAEIEVRNSALCECGSLRRATVLWHRIAIAKERTAADVTLVPLLELLKMNPLLVLGMAHLHRHCFLVLRGCAWDA